MRTMIGISGYNKQRDGYAYLTRAVLINGLDLMVCQNRLAANGEQAALLTKDAEAALTTLILL